MSDLLGGGCSVFFFFRSFEDSQQIGMNCGPSLSDLPQEFSVDE